jgi:hypothetical protein
VAPASDGFFHGTGVLGVTSPICRDPVGYEPFREAIVVPADLISIGAQRLDESGATLAHEIFHAFAQGIAGRDDYRLNWFDEAAAEWATDNRFAVDRPELPSNDQAFLRRPEIPLDTSPGRTRTERLHPYGARAARSDSRRR